jgi:hypothetical protein
MNEQTVQMGRGWQTLAAGNGCWCRRTHRNRSETVEGRHAMRDSDSVHKKVQEMCDCYATADPLKEMSTLDRESDTHSAAIKWIALAALHGVNANAENISVSNENGRTTVVALYRETELPSPGNDIGRTIVDAIKEMSHIDGGKGEISLALGIRDSSFDMGIKMDAAGNGSSITISFR